jgi:hypothetical protein
MPAELIYVSLASLNVVGNSAFPTISCEINVATPPRIKRQIAI